MYFRRPHCKECATTYHHHIPSESQCFPIRRQIGQDSSMWSMTVPTHIKVMTRHASRCYTLKPYRSINLKIDLRDRHSLRGVLGRRQVMPLCIMWYATKPVLGEIVNQTICLTLGEVLTIQSGATPQDHAHHLHGRTASNANSARRFRDIRVRIRTS